MTNCRNISPWIADEDDNSFLGSLHQTTFTTISNTDLQEDQRNDQVLEIKMHEILKCLNGISLPNENRLYNGNDVQIIDLWQLRQLALSRGGLINSSIRKRAWPKLIGLDSQIITKSVSMIPSDLSLNFSNKEDDSCDIKCFNEQNNGRTITRDEIKQIRNVITQSPWHVEYHIKKFRRHTFYKSGNERCKQTMLSDDGGNASASDLSVDEFSSKTSSKTTRLSPQRIILSPSSKDTKLPISSSHSESTERRAEETILLLNIIASVLQIIPGETKGSGVDNSLHCYLVDVASLLLINLESPSLTSLAMKELVHYHLSDVLKPNMSGVRKALRVIFSTLLSKVDTVLHDFLLKAGICDYSFALDWIVSWFGHNIHDVLIASRLFDVFISSHPLFPYYFSVAILTLPFNRAKILATDCEKENLKLVSLLASLPTRMMSVVTYSINLVSDNFEDAIELALRYIEEIPPQKLISLILKSERNGKRIDLSLSMVNNILPSWATKSTTLTDYCVLKKANEIRNMKLSRIDSINQVKLISKSFTGHSSHSKLAKNAMGIEPDIRILKRGTIIFLYFAVTAWVVFIYTNTGQRLINKYLGVYKVHPSTSSNKATANSFIIENTSARNIETPKHLKELMSTFEPNINLLFLEDVMNHEEEIFPTMLTENVVELKIENISLTLPISHDSEAVGHANYTMISKPNIFRKKPFIHRELPDDGLHRNQCKLPDLLFFPLIKNRYSSTVVGWTYRTETITNFEDEWQRWEHTYSMYSTGRINRKIEIGRKLRQLIENDIYVILFI